MGELPVDSLTAGTPVNLREEATAGLTNAFTMTAMTGTYCASQIITLLPALVSTYSSWSADSVAPQGAKSGGC